MYNEIDYVVMESEIETINALSNYWTKEIIIMESVTDKTIDDGLFKRIINALLKVITKLRHLISDISLRKKLSKYYKLRGIELGPDLYDDNMDFTITGTVPSPISKSELKQIARSYQELGLDYVIQDLKDGDISKEKMKEKMVDINEIVSDMRNISEKLLRSSQAYDETIPDEDFINTIEWLFGYRDTISNRHSVSRYLSVELDKLEKVIRKISKESRDSLSPEKIEYFNDLLQCTTKITSVALNITKGFHKWLDFLIAHEKKSGKSASGDISTSDLIDWDDIE